MTEQHMDEKIIAYMNGSPAADPAVHWEPPPPKIWTEDEIQTAVDNDATLIYQGEKLHFIPFRLLQDQLSICLPDGFSLLSPARAAEKYSAWQSLQFIYSDAAGAVNAIFNHSDNPLPDDDTQLLQHTMAANLKKLQPSAEFLDEDRLIHSPAAPVACFEVLLPALDGLTYNLMFSFPLRQRAVIGSVNCPEAYMPFWQSAAKVLLTTLTVQPQ